MRDGDSTRRSCAASKGSAGSRARRRSGGSRRARSRWMGCAPCAPRPRCARAPRSRSWCRPLRRDDRGRRPSRRSSIVLYEDDDLIVVNKPAGIVVHPTYKQTAGTVLNGLLWHLRTARRRHAGHPHPARQGHLGPGGRGPLTRRPRGDATRRRGRPGAQGVPRGRHDGALASRRTDHARARARPRRSPPRGAHGGRSAERDALRGTGVVAHGLARPL